MCFGKASCFCSPFLAIRRCQPDADSAFVDLKAQATLLVILGLLAQFREFGGIGKQPLLQLRIMDVNLCDGIFCVVKKLP